MSRSELIETSVRNTIAPIIFEYARNSYQRCCASSHSGLTNEEIALGHALEIAVDPLGLRVPRICSEFNRLSHASPI